MNTHDTNSPLLGNESLQHDANGVKCDSELSSQLKSAAYGALKMMTGESKHEVPVMMSGAGHDAMAMSHLTKVCSSPLYRDNVS